MTCITHHYACDCREAEFAALQAENERLRTDYAALRAIADNGQRLLDEAAAIMADHQEQIARLTTLADDAIALATQHWQPQETAPFDEWVILATTGEWVGQAIRYNSHDGTHQWVWADTGSKVNHVPLGWQPFPIHRQTLAGAAS